MEAELWYHNHTEIIIMPIHTAYVGIFAVCNFHGLRE